MYKKNTTRFEGKLPQNLPLTNILIWLLPWWWLICIYGKFLSIFVPHSWVVGNCIVVWKPKNYL